MKLIIDIPDEIYQEAIKSGYSHLYDEEVANAVAEGTPLDELIVENKGEWIYQEGVTPYKWRCNKCERMFKTDFNYCPNCGADMRGECKKCAESEETDGKKA